MADSNAEASSSKSGMNTRQRRILPSRNRRGGPGIGSCDADVMILETQQRQVEQAADLPDNYRFLLTTNSSMVPTEPGTYMEEALVTEKYFDRPDVLKAYREQQEIQTPEFRAISEIAAVGGRFRPRTAEFESIDTSDTAYEKRHRKYETFEKRLRFREKEKLKHEQYKLKERIEQLRGMDASAFLALPASTFPPAANGQESQPDVHTLNNAEGERRRKEMLAVAVGLEERYAALLLEKKPGVPNGTRASASITAETASGSDKEEEESEGEDVDVDVDELEDELEETSKLELSRKKSRLKESAAKNARSSHALVRNGVIRIGRLPSEFPAAPIPSSAARLRLRNSAAAPSPGMSISTADDEPARGGLRIFNAGKMSDNVEQAESISQAPRKRQKLPPMKPKTQKPVTISAPARSNTPYGSESTHWKHRDQPGVLVIAALRSAETGRKSSRESLPFGVKLPTGLEEPLDFVLPDDILPYEDQFSDGGPPEDLEDFEFMASPPPPDPPQVASQSSSGRTLRATTRAARDLENGTGTTRDDEAEAAAALDMLSSEGISKHTSSAMDTS